MSKRRLPLAVPLPTLADVLYEPPLGTYARKACDNCGLYMREEGGRCFLHERSLVVRPDAVCGYHVPGTPSEFGEATDLLWDHIEALDPDLSGLMRVPGGTSCDTCRYYEADKPGREGYGICHAVQASALAVAVSQSTILATVEARGCCSRWTKKGAT